MKKILHLVFNIFFMSSLFAQDCTDLFFSEYVEGPGNNNGVEIYNPSTSTFDLSAYTVNRYGNGASSSPDTWALSGSIAPGQTITIGNGQTDSVWVQTYWSLPVDSVFFSACDLTCSGIYPTPFYFNGDDAITLEKDGGILDIIGKVGEDPGSAWTDDATAGYTDANGGTWWTKRQTLVRKSSVKKGVTMNPIVFNPTLEWDSLPDATYSGLGSHNCDCITSTNIQNSSNSSYVVYPNPANAGDNISISTFENIKKIKLYSIEGKQFVVNPINSKNFLVRSNELKPGNYILKILFESGNTVDHTIVVQ